MQIQKTVFISYRRTNIYMARAVYGHLRSSGYDVFLDYQSLDSGDFSQNLLSQIAARAHFVVILTPSALERCTTPDDWMRKEIEYAIEQKRNVIPLLFEGFKFQDVKHYLVSDWLKVLPSYNGLSVPDAYFDEAMIRLCSNRYLDKDIATVVHPLTQQIAAATIVMQAKVDATPAPTHEQLETERLFEQAFKKEQLSDYDGAIVDCNEILRINPNYVNAYITRGDIFREKGDYDKAIVDYSEAIRLDPQHISAYNGRARAFGNIGNFNAAIADFSEAIRLEPEISVFYYNRGLTHVDRADYNAAIADFNETIRLDPKDADAYDSRGTVYHYKGDYAKAIDDYTKAIDLNPQSLLFYCNRGNALNDKGDYDKAIADFSNVIRLNPQDEYAYLGRMLAYRTSGDLDKMIADCRLVLQINPYNNTAKQYLENAQQIKSKQ